MCTPVPHLADRGTEAQGHITKKLLELELELIQSASIVYIPDHLVIQIKLRI
jgi:hypothetical protein